MIRKVLTGTVAPIIITAVWLGIAYAISSSIFLEAEFIIKFWILGGIPFGWKYSVHLIPLRGGFAMIVGVVILDILMAGIIGSVMIAFTIIKAVINLISALFLQPGAVTV
ncbi:hypothetical protein [Butyrivibrio sp. INlla16]|uniref:hypothetical protein n=1 Tax=Butyrivibrio sp. INlla16 TaxID=1520807 RepID=UPI000884AE36|nr:hypothetical protein [Butyrivibrio sp. INlla16]SDB62261.1 hypothetical protein SAMN02910263_03355 [Butyrivibrio sp. INlla16]